MNAAVDCREATRADLPDILHLYAQPDLDDGRVLPLAEAERLFDRIARYPDYALHVAIREGRIVGSFALLIMDNLAHRGAPSGVIEDVAVDPERQGQGVGRAMMPQAFYESLGFERHGYSYRITPPPSADAAPEAPVRTPTQPRKDST